MEDEIGPVLFELTGHLDFKHLCRCAHIGVADEWADGGIADLGFGTGGASARGRAELDAGLPTVFEVGLCGLGLEDLRDGVGGDFGGAFGEDCGEGRGIDVGGDVAEEVLRDEAEEAVLFAIGKSGQESSGVARAFGLLGAGELAREEFLESGGLHGVERGEELAHP